MCNPCTAENVQPILKTGKLTTPSTPRAVTAHPGGVLAIDSIFCFKMDSYEYECGARHRVVGPEQRAGACGQLGVGNETK